MNCPECEGHQKSEVYDRGGLCTLMGSLNPHFWDEDGNEHFHDPNITTTHYECSAGHKWTVKTRKQCPACDYGATQRSAPLEEGPKEKV